MTEKTSDRGKLTESTFDWRVFADATCAGLTALVPLPFVDLVFEGFFRRRIPRAVAGRLGMNLDPEVEKELGRKPFEISMVHGCLWIPLRVFKYVLRRIWRKVIYVLAIADTVDQVGYYWHRAYLIQHVLRDEYVGSKQQNPVASVVFHQVLKEADTSPIKAAAKRVVRSVHRVLLLLRRARKRGSAQTLVDQEAIFKANWPGIEEALQTVVLRFESLYLERVQTTESESSGERG
jgi:hypothetical protein